PTLAHLHIADLGGNNLQFAILYALPGSTYDLYFVNSISAQRWQWRRVYAGVQCDNTGQATFTLQKPEPNQGFFVILDAADDDGDGLSNGYECWFNYSGRRTCAQNADSDGDGLPDGWEVEYGLDPTDPNGNNGTMNCPCNPD